MIAAIIVVDDSSGRGRGRGLCILPHDQVIQTHLKVVSQSDDVVQVRLGRAGLPLLYRLAGDAHQVGQLLLRQSGFPPELVEPLMKFHDIDLLRWIWPGDRTMVRIAKKSGLGNQRLSAI